MENKHNRENSPRETFAIICLMIGGGCTFIFLIVCTAVDIKVVRDLLGLSVCVLLAGAIAGRSMIAAFIGRMRERTQQLTQHQIDTAFISMFITAIIWVSIMSFVYYEANDMINDYAFMLTYKIAFAALLLTSLKGLRPAANWCFEIVFDE